MVKPHCIECSSGSYVLRSTSAGFLRHGVCVRSLLNHLKFYFLCLRLLVLPKNRQLVFGLSVNDKERRFLSAFAPDAIAIRANYFRGGFGFREHSARRKLTFIQRLLPSGTKTVVWGYRDHINLGFSFEEYFGEVTRIEAGLVPGPACERFLTSYIFSSKGMYFDGRQPSQLEEALNALTKGDIDRRLENEKTIDTLVKRGVTKFSPLDSEAYLLEEGSVLIIGQVRGDQALTYTDTVCATNTHLVEQVLSKTEWPETKRFYYKAHPKNKTNEREIADLQYRFPELQIVPEKQNIIELLEQQPIVATITSGVGLEAALRGCVVHCYGVSFYSNWGFTVDHVSCSRRTNTLRPIDVAVELMIRQSVYVDPETGHAVPLGTIYR